MADTSRTALERLHPEVRHLLAPRTIRERAEAAYALAEAGRLDHFHLDLSRLDDVVSRVERVTRAAYPDVRRIPHHGRYRHFGVGGVDRVAAFEARIQDLPRDERLCARFELVIVSVLLDAGAGPGWSYRDARGAVFTRSEGLAVASYDLLERGDLAGDPEHAPLRADTSTLSCIDTTSLARAFQVTAENPLVGLEGRAALLRSVGRAVETLPAWFGESAPRLGNVALAVERDAGPEGVTATGLLQAVLLSLGSIWPGRETLHGVDLGDVWLHPALGRVPFHKLSQWLTYSLCEPLQAEGIHVSGIEALTGLPEYRNGGLFVDSGVIVPRDPAVLAAEHDVSSTLVVEWRALTVALLERVAAMLRSRLGLREADLPLAKVLEGGTWSAGREIARERREDGSPPLRVRSDGTVF